MSDDLETRRLLREIDYLKRTRNFHGPIAMQAVSALKRGDMTKARALMILLRASPTIDPAS